MNIIVIFCIFVPFSTSMPFKADWGGELLYKERRLLDVLSLAYQNFEHFE